MEASTLLRGVTVLFVIDTFLDAVSLSRIHLYRLDHLKSDSSQIMGKSFSYETLRGVRSNWSD